MGKDKGRETGIHLGSSRRPTDPNVLAAQKKALRAMINTLRTLLQTTAVPVKGLRLHKSAMRPPKKINNVGRLGYGEREVEEEIGKAEDARRR
ncbi:hypothetical protein TrRE_jg7560 [Triparma retinervis]|uniref:Uncharacterized protein n=1 Tax=Triparma retinervis TaxID=2557542 RepID=A0A9W7AQW0_9STRA|nr:hypothetical protein TrRE_jg7560 [Triparma retinervis]